MTAKDIFENAISREEQRILANAYKFDDETQEEFCAKISRHIMHVCVPIGNARDIPGINGICPGLSCIWQGYRVTRRRVDELDNVYVSRDRNENRNEN